MKMNENQKFAAPLFKQWLPLNLQFFADGGDDGSDDDDSDDDGDDSADEMNLDELLKDPAFKKQYQAKLKEQLNKRMKKYADIDPDEYRRLKEQADKKKGKDKEDDEESDSLSKEKEQKLLRAERREKRAAVKEFAADNGHNPKLLARLIDIDAIELDDDGEPENLDELFEELEAEFPEYFGQQDDEEDEPEKKKKSGYKPGSSQKGNKPKDKDNYQVGLSSYERLKKSGRIR